MFTVKKITHKENFRAIRDQWNTLLNGSKSNNISLTWEWMYTWWEVFNEGRELCILTVWNEEELIAIAPLLKRRIWHYKVIPFWRLEFLASGENMEDEVCSDYLDFIIKSGMESEAMRVLADYLMHQIRGEWDEMVLADIAEDSENLRHLEELLKERDLQWEVVDRISCFYIKLPETWDEYLESLSSGMRYKIRRGRRELTKQSAQYRIAKDRDELEKALEILIKLHQDRWTDKGKPGVFSSQKFMTFHRRLMPLSFQNDWLKLHSLLLRGESIAAHYNFRYNHKIYFYQSGMSLTDNKHIRPGILLHSYCIEEAIDAGLAEYDFLKGDSDYKRALSTDSRAIVIVRVSRNCIKERRYRAIKRGISYLGKVRMNSGNGS